MKRFALLAILALTGAQAGILADEFRTQHAEHDGLTQFLWMADETEFPQWSMQLQARSAIVEAKETVYLQATDSFTVPLLGETIPSVAIPSDPLDEGNPKVTHYQNVRGNLSYIQPGVAMALQVTDGSYKLHADRHTIRQFTQPYFDGAGGIQDGYATPSEGGTYTARAFDPLLVSELNKGNFNGTIQGDIVLEVEYADFAIETASGSHVIRGTHDDAAQTTGNSDRTERSLRITLLDATITIASSNFEGVLQQVIETATLSGLQSPRVINATGTIGSLELSQESAGLFVHALNLAPGEEKLSVEQPKQTETSALLGIAANSANFLWALLLTPLLLLARPKATYQRMEGAIEDGRYRKATRIANRLLRRKPDEERATLGWAIAQSKRGNFQQAATRLESWLKKHEATDGVFPYVIGMAYMDLGKQEKAANWFDVAVQMTPSLENEIPRGPVVAEHAYV